MAKLTSKQKEGRAAERRREAALAAVADHERREAVSRNWAENGLRLTREELEAGVACRGCGLPIIDGLGNWPPMLHMSDEQRAEHEDAEADYRARHGSCRDSRWSMSGSRTAHCSLCCPPPPMSSHQLESIAATLSRPRDPAERAPWRLVLTCGHDVERTQHRTHRTWTTRVVECATCGRARGVLETESIAPRDEAAEPTRRRSRADSADDTAAELARLERKVAGLKQRIDELRGPATGD